MWYSIQVQVHWLVVVRREFFGYLGKLRFTHKRSLSTSMLPRSALDLTEGPTYNTPCSLRILV